MTLDDLFRELGERLVVALKHDELAEQDPLALLIAGLALVVLEHDGTIDTSGIPYNKFDKFGALGLHPTSHAFTFGHGWCAFLQERAEGVRFDLLLVHEDAAVGRVAVRFADSHPDLDARARYLRRRGWYVLHYSVAALEDDPVRAAREIHALTAELTQEHAADYDGASLEHIGGPGSRLGQIQASDYKAFAGIFGFERHGDESVFQGQIPEVQPFDAARALALAFLSPHLRRPPDRGS